MKKLFYWFLSTFFKDKEFKKYRVDTLGNVYQFVGFWPDGEIKEKLLTPPDNK